jgi:hypothetical protein
MYKATFLRDDILNQLDNCQSTHLFPILDNGYIYYADARLSIYGDISRWAVVIEVLGANHRLGSHNSIENCLYYFGNCLYEILESASEDILHPTSDGLDEQTFTDEYEWYVRTDAKTLRLRDRVTPLHLDPLILSTKGIILVEPPEITAADLLRHLVVKYREQLFATENELRRRIPLDVPLLLRLDAWYHPNLLEGEIPSHAETFQLLADVLTTGDPSLYSPRKIPNTHWTHWPDSGIL